VSDKESATTNEQAHRVREMFATIAARYDLLNHLLSVNIDKRWRRLVAKTLFATLSNSEARILDVACGTGDLSLTLFESGQARIVGIDFCRPMLDLAASKAAKAGSVLPFVEGDALDLPFADRSFEAVTIAFGLRNLKAPVLRSLFGMYFTKLLPLFGGWISGSKSAYEYLPDSVSRFPDQDELAGMMKEAGFEAVSYQNLTGGIAALHLGTRPM
jgi:demethylmenaquinone methyltransferase/2-methoxy-6-polyprenyl-1,4-benzoquinol methylase